MDDSADSYASDIPQTSTPACHQGTESEPIEWTDEKHSLYLRSMETTFVNHLYKLLAQQSHKNIPLGPKLSRHKPTGISTPSGQYKVLRFGCWSKIDFVSEEPKANPVEESGATVLSANPWIRHYRCSGRRMNRKVLPKVTFATTTTTPADKSPAHDPFQLCSEDSDNDDTEVTDQNFNDDSDNLDEEKSSTVQNNAKRARTMPGIESTTDQVVPYEDIVQDVDADDNAMGED